MHLGDLGRVFFKTSNKKIIFSNLSRGPQLNFNKKYKGCRFILAFPDVLYSPCIFNLSRGLQFNFNKRYKGRRFILAFLDVLFSPCLGLVLGHSKINRFWVTKKIVTKKCIFVENMLSPK